MQWSVKSVSNPKGERRVHTFNFSSGVQQSLWELVGAYLSSQSSEAPELKTYPESQMNKPNLEFAALDHNHFNLERQNVLFCSQISIHIIKEKYITHCIVQECSEILKTILCCNPTFKFFHIDFEYLIFMLINIYVRIEILIFIAKLNMGIEIKLTKSTRRYSYTIVRIHFSWSLMIEIWN